MDTSLITPNKLAHDALPQAPVIHNGQEQGRQLRYRMVQACQADEVRGGPWGGLQVDGNKVTWEKWHIRTSFNYREGLVLHDVGCATLNSHPP